MNHLRKNRFVPVNCSVGIKPKLLVARNELESTCWFSGGVVKSVFLIFLSGGALAGPFKIHWIFLFRYFRGRAATGEVRRTNLTSCRSAPRTFYSREVEGAGRRKIGRLVGTECIGHEKLATKWAVMIPQSEQERRLISTVFLFELLWPECLIKGRALPWEWESAYLK